MSRSSSPRVHKLCFGRVHDLDAIFDFQLHDDGDPIKSRVHMWLATEFEWEDRPVIEFRFTDSAEGLSKARTIQTHDEAPANTSRARA
jgi:hypothetical protein